MSNSIINVPKSGQDLLDRIGNNIKPLPLWRSCDEYIALAYDDPEARPLCLSFNGENVHGTVKNDAIMLAAWVIRKAQEKGDSRIPNHAGRVAAALNHCRRKGGIGAKQLLLASKG